jgi:hypothetical protein
LSNTEAIEDFMRVGATMAIADWNNTISVPNRESRVASIERTGVNVRARSHSRYSVLGTGTG